MQPQDDLQHSIQQLAKLDISAHLIESVDLGQLVNRIKNCCDKIDSTGQQLHSISKASFLRLLWGNITGKNSQTLAEAIEAQGELAKDQLALLLLNTAIAKNLNNQQETLSQQQSSIIDQNSELKIQNEEIKQLTQKSLEQQQTILRLLTLTDAQEASIRNLFKKAKALEDIEDNSAKKWAKHEALYREDISRVDDELLRVTQSFSNLENECGLREARIVARIAEVASINETAIQELLAVVNPALKDQSNRLRAAEELIRRIRYRQRLLMSAIIVVSVAILAFFLFSYRWPLFTLNI